VSGYPVFPFPVTTRYIVSVLRSYPHHFLRTARSRHPLFPTSAPRTVPSPMRKHIRFLLCNAILLPIVVAERTATAGDTTEPRSPPTLSKASVFSTILALWICCLTLPYGALLVPGGCSWLLRLSPISAALEGLVVIFCLLLIPLQLPCGPAHDGSAMEIFTNPPQAAGVGAGASYAGEVLPSSTPVTQPSPPGWDFSHGLRRYRAVAGALLLFRSRKYSTSSDITNEDIESQFASHKIRRMDILATISVSFIFIKMCVISGAPLFVACGFMYICFWVSVQALLCLVHWNGSDSTQLETVRECFRHVSRVDNWDFWRLLRMIAVSVFDMFAEEVYLGGGEEIPPQFRNATLIAVHMVILALMVISCVPDFFIDPYAPRSLLESLGYAILAILILVEAFMMIWLPGASALQPTVLCFFGLLVDVLIYLLSFLLKSEAVQSLLKKLYWRKGHLLLSYRFAMYELFVVGCNFWLYFLQYRDEGTTKPEWLEWIGM